ncbi:MAG: radical SAM protein [Desulfarculales bacterium]|jgi:MoaA/NifB/PqqE/SkfB family radical SAM enzyme|nr:radical SAM protein [Desulfarculales bacterium]
MSAVHVSPGVIALEWENAAVSGMRLSFSQAFQEALAPGDTISFFAEKWKNTSVASCSFLWKANQNTIVLQGGNEFLRACASHSNQSLRFYISRNGEKAQELDLDGVTRELLPFDPIPPPCPADANIGYFIAQIRDGALIVSGWSLLMENGASCLPLRLIVMEGNTVLGICIPSVPRRDVVAAKGQGTPVNSGFAACLYAFDGDLQDISVWADNGTEMIPLAPQFIEHMAVKKVRALPPEVQELLHVDKLSQVVFGLTYACNLRCVYCTTRAQEELTKVEDPDILLPWDDSFIDGLSPYTGSVYLIGNGELTMRKGWQEIFGKIKGRGLTLSCISNLSRRLNEDDLSVLATVDNLGISLDTPDKKLHSATRIGSDFDIIISNIKSIKNIQKQNNISANTYFSCVVHEMSAETLPDLAQLCIDLDMQGIACMSLSAASALKERGHELNQLFSLSDEKIARLSQKIREFADLLEKNNKFYWLCPDLIVASTAPDSNCARSLMIQCDGVYTPKIEPGMTRDCHFAWQELNFLAGSVSPCCTMRTQIPYNDALPLNKIINHPMMLQVRYDLYTGQLNTICRRCNLAGPIRVEDYQRKIPTLKRLVGTPWPYSGKYPWLSKTAGF